MKVSYYLLICKRVNTKNINLIHLLENPLQFTGDESDVDSVLAKLIDLKLSTLILRKKEDKQAGNESEVDGGDNGKKKELSKEKI